MFLLFYYFILLFCLLFWNPKQNLSIDEGMISLKGKIHFKVFNPNKLDKYWIKNFKLYDSSKGYCLKSDLHVGKTSRRF